MASDKSDKYCVLMVFVSCVFIIATAGVVLGALCLAQIGFGSGARYNIYAQTSGAASSDSGTSSGSTSTTTDDDEVWLFAIGDYDNRVEYLDPVTNQLKGYNADIIDAVCDIANKNCELVWDLYSNCWETVDGERSRGAVGLMGGWYTACTGWIQTYDRLLTYDFTRPFAQKGKVALYAKQGSSRAYDDLTGAKVGFLATWFADDTCLSRYTTDASYPVTGADLPADSQKVNYQTIDDLIDAVNNDEVDVAFAPKFPQLDAGLQQISPEDFSNNCEAGGPSMMTSKRNKEFVRWWNDAFARLVGTSRYDAICLNLINEHSDLAGGEPTDICIGY